MMRTKKKNILKSGWDSNPQPKDKHDLERLRQFYHPVALQFLGFVFILSYFIANPQGMNLL